MLNFHWSNSTTPEFFLQTFPKEMGGGGTQVVIVYCFYSHTEGAFEN